MREAKIAHSLSQIDLQVNSKTGSVVSIEAKKPEWHFQQLSDSEKQVGPHESHINLIGANSNRVL